MDMFYNFDLKQYVQCSTHTSGNTLDLIVARDNSDLDISTPTESWYISDHCFIECNLKFSKPHSEKKRISYRKIKNIDSVKFANDLQKVVQDLENISDLSELAEQYSPNGRFLVQETFPKTLPRFVLILISLQRWQQ